jgi:ferredoxin
MERRGFLAAAAATTGALASAGCLGLTGDRSPTGPRDTGPTAVDDGSGTNGGGEGTETTVAEDIETFAIEFLNEEATIDVASNEALLYAGLDEGWNLPYQCERGICGQCTAKVDGDGSELVEHQSNDYLSDAQIEAGFVLTCVAQPRAEFAIETDMQDAADSFTGGEETPTTTAENVETYDVEFLTQETTIDVASNEALLYAGLDEGWDLPYSCEHGVCGQCTAKVEGDANELVRHDGNEYLSQEQIDAGFVLTCVGYPEGDLALETDMQDAADQV